MCGEIYSLRTLQVDRLHFYVIFFFFNDTATTEIYTLSLHDALPICGTALTAGGTQSTPTAGMRHFPTQNVANTRRSEEHTSELQSRLHLVCRLLLEKKKQDRHDERVCDADQDADCLGPIHP